MRDATGDSTFTYDANGRLVSYTNALSATVGYAYNENGEIAAITYPDGKTVGYAYDALGRMAKVTGRDGGETIYAYDAQDNVTEVTRADGSVTTAEYDALGRVETLTNFDGAGETVSSFAYTYDATGNIVAETVSMEGETVERSYAYTDRGELASVTENGETTLYTYDAAGNRIKEEGPAGTTVYLYDEADRLQSTEGARVSAYTWDADGNLIAQKDGDAAYEYLYDTESRLLAVREGGSLLMSVLYDGLDNRSYGLEYKMIDRHLNQFPHLPGYWNNGHWNCIPDAPDAPKNGKQAAQDDTAAQADNAVETEAGEQSLWDTVSGWFADVFGGEDADAGIDVQSSAKPADGNAKGNGNADGDYTNNGGADNDHGGNGNTNNGNGKPGNNGNGNGNNGNNGNGNGSSKGEGEPISDWARKKLTKLGFTEMDLEMLERLGVTDADTRRIVETASVPNTGNGPTHFIPAYDLMFYVNDINRENVEVLTQGSRYTSDTAYEYGVQRLAADHEGERETYLYDGRGSVVQLLQGGTVSQSYSYNAYGYINADEYGIHAPFFGYNGEEQNPFTGLQYLRARYYAPQNGGFITQDSFSGILTNALSQNRYTYAENDPVNGIDPSGHAKAPGGATKGGGTSKTSKDGQSLRSGRMSASTSRTSSSAKPTYTTPPARPSSTSSSSRRPLTMDHLPTGSRMPAYTSGAARAALSARLGSAASHPSAELTGRLMSNAHQPMRKSSSSLPVVIENFVEGAKSFIRKTCDATTQYYERQAENKRLELLGWQTIGKVSGQAIEKYGEYVYQDNQQKLEQERLVADTQFQLAFSSAVLFGAHVFGRQPIPKEVSDANYAVNSELDATNTEAGIVGPGIYINGQGLHDFPSYQFGNGSNIGAMGCLTISLYNANIRLDDYESLADIQYGIETNGYVARLNSGSVATYIPKYFEEKGYDVHFNLAPTPEELEQMARDNDTVIITRYNTSSPFGGSHYMNLFYNDETGQFELNNWSNTVSESKKYSSLAEIYGESVNRPYFVYGISGGGK